MIPGDARWGLVQTHRRMKGLELLSACAVGQRSSHNSFVKCEQVATNLQRQVHQVRLGWGRQPQDKPSPCADSPPTSVNRSFWKS
jgi:hypothetical protein